MPLFALFSLAQSAAFAAVAAAAVVATSFVTPAAAATAAAFPPPLPPLLLLLLLLPLLLCHDGKCLARRKWRLLTLNGRGDAEDAFVLVAEAMRKVKEGALEQKRKGEK